MRILQVCPDFPPEVGGIGRHVHQICSGLPEFAFDVLTLQRGRLSLQREDADNISVTRIPVWKMAIEIPHLEKLMKLRFEQYDIVHVHSYQSLLSAFASVRFTSPILFTPHYHPYGSNAVLSAMKWLYRPTGRHIISRAERIIAVSAPEFEVFGRDFPSAKEKLILVHEGVDYQRFKRLGPARRLSEDVVLTYVGRLERYKGVMELLRCFRILVTDYPSLALRIVGQGPLWPAINRFISEARLSQSVKVHPFVRDWQLVELLSSSDIFVLPSEYEAFGLAAAEAMACELPVVASAVGGLRELVVDGQTGILLPSPVKIRDLRGALEKLILDGELRARMGAKARARVLSHFRLERMLELHRQIYTSTGKNGHAFNV